MAKRIPAGAMLLSLGLAGCGGVKVVPLGAEVRPRPVDCAIEFLEQAPARPFEEIAQLTTTLNPGDGEARQALRAPACAVGADAVLVTRKIVTSALGHTLVSGTALRWSEQRPSEVPAEAPPLPADRKPAGATTL